MPLLTFDIIKGRSKDEINLLLDTAHQAVLTAFKVPERDRYQIVNEHERYLMIFQDTGLGFERSNNLVMVRVYTRPRDVEQKTFFMLQLANNLKKNCRIQGNDLMITFITNTDSDWSFANGEAQFLTGKL